MATPVVTAAQRALFRGGAYQAPGESWTEAERGAYRAEAAFSRAYSRWVAAAVGSAEERAAWREVRSLDAARRRQNVGGNR